MHSLKSRRERAALILSHLKGKYPDPEPPLDHRDPFTFLVAVALSAQTTDARVNLVTPALFDRAPTPGKMAALSEAEILSFIRTCGLAPTKAKNIRKLSQIIVERFQGHVPETFEELESLPGVGHKTASVVMSQIYGVPAFPVDTHVHRLASRWKLSNGKSVEKTEADLKAVFPEKSWSQVSLQIIFYGREFCTARGCDGHTCALCSRLNGTRARKGSSSRNSRSVR
ncbi:endonuclease III [bacterium]|jgi:endonuclease-3|nr:endonuclease III [bacterium]